MTALCASLPLLLMLQGGTYSCRTRRCLAQFRKLALTIIPTPSQAYPFLAQVCRHWKGVLESREALPALWSDLVVDFSHELITGACGKRVPCLPAAVSIYVEG